MEVQRELQLTNAFGDTSSNTLIRALLFNNYFGFWSLYNHQKKNKISFISGCNCNSIPLDLSKDNS